MIKARYVFRQVNKTIRAFKLCRFTREKIAPNKIVYIVINDSKSIEVINQDIHVNDHIMYNINIKEIIKRIIMAANILNIVSDGLSTKKIETINLIFKQDGNFDLVTVNDARDYTFNTRINYVFIILKSDKSAITLPKGNWFENFIQKETECRMYNERL